MSHDWLIFRDPVTFAVRMASLRAGLGVLATVAILGLGPCQAHATLPISVGMTLRPIGLDNQIGRDRGPVAAALAVASSAAGRTAAIDRNPVQRKSMMTNGRLLIARTCYPCVLAKVAPEPHPEKLGRLERIAASRDVDMHWWSDGGFLTLDDLEVDTDGAKDKSKKKEPEKAEAPHHDVTPSACARFRTLCKPEHRPP